MLGVVGAVIGTIWVAASSVTENNRIRRTAEVSLSMVEATRNLFRGNAPNTVADQIAGSSVPNSTYVRFTFQMRDAGVIPSDIATDCRLISGDSAWPACAGLWGFDQSVFAISAVKRTAGLGAGIGYFSLALGIPPSACVRVGRALAQALGKPSSGILEIEQWPSNYTKPEHMTMWLLRSNCDGNPSFDIKFN